MIGRGAALSDFIDRQIGYHHRWRDPLVPDREVQRYLSAVLRRGDGLAAGVSRGVWQRPNQASAPVDLRLGETEIPPTDGFLMCPETMASYVTHLVDRP